MRSTVLSRIPRRGTLIVAATLLAFVNCEQVEITTVSASRVELQPPTASIAVTETTRLSATVLSSDGKVLSGRAVAWTSQAQSIATVDNTGMVRGMAAGVATIRASSGEASGTATVTVTAAPSIALSATTITFTAVQNGAVPGDRSITVTNGGTGTLSGLSVTVRYAAGQPTAWLTAALATTSAPTALILSANQRNFTPGNYDATVDVASSVPGIATRSLTVRLTVASPSPAIGMGTNTVAFTATQNGADPAQQTVGLTNAGGGSLTGLATTVDYPTGQRTGWLSASLSGTSAPATLTIRATTGSLPIGPHTGNVRVTSSVAQNSPQTVVVTFNVLSTQAGISLGQTAIAFAAERGGSNPATQNVQVTSLGSTQLTNVAVAVTYGAGQPTDWLTANLAGTTTPTSIALTAATGTLGLGTYNATIAVSSPTASNSPQTLNVTFNVAEPIAPVTGLTATPVSGTQINLAWAGQAAAVGRYRIERKTATGSYAAIDSVSGATLSYQNSGLNAATQYFYRIQACNTLGCSAYSAEASATTGPGAPTSLTASTVSPGTQINLTWGAPVGSITRYRIERKTGAAGTYAVIDSVPTGTLSYQNSSLPQATQFFYRVQACGTLCSAYSNEASATTGLLAPGAPPSLGATAVSASQISLSWGASSGIVTSYRIERMTGAGGTYAVIDSTAGTSYQNGGLAAGTQYFYRVQACNAGGCSPYSPEANATTFQVPPGAPPSLSAALAGPTQINLSWGASSGTVATYKIERKIGSGGTYAVIDSTASTAYQNSGLSAGTEYFYRVQACNSAGCSGYSPEASMTTPPSPPSGLSATTASASQINLAWTASAGAVSTYRIEQKTGAAGTYVLIDSTASTGYSRSGLSSSTEYFYRVQACNSGGCSGYSNESSATTLAVPPGAPTNLNATPVPPSQINLSWAAASGVVTWYRIERGPTNTSFAPIDSVGSGVTTYANGSGLAPQTTYFYRVNACNSAGCGPYSNEASATTFPVPPGAPSGLSANAVSASQIDLAWGAASGTVADYRIERSTSSGGAFAQIDVVAAGTLTYNNTGLASATEYFYRVRACNPGGCSGYSNVASDTTFLVPPTPPTSVTATAASSTQINLAWSGATGLVATYNVFRKDSISGTGYQVVASGSGTSYSDNGLAAGTKYFYQVQACNLAGCSGMSPEASAITFPPPPSAPGTLSATAVSASQIDLVWGPSTGTVSKYFIDRKTSGATYAVIDSTTSTSYSNTGLSASTQYFYQVRACNVSGCASSSEATATTQAVPPPAPTGVMALISGSQIAVSWTASPGTVANYLIERRAGGGTFTLFMTVSGSSTSWVDTGPFTVALSDYAYRIQACNSAGCSTYSNVANAH